jgi:hypothetical protein
LNPKYVSSPIAMKIAAPLMKKAVRTTLMSGNLS